MRADESATTRRQAWLQGDGASAVSAAPRAHLQRLHGQRRVLGDDEPEVERRAVVHVPVLGPRRVLRQQQAAGSKRVVNSCSPANVSCVMRWWSQARCLLWATQP